MSTFFALSDLGLTASPSQLLQQFLNFMQQTYPGYTPQSGNLEYIMAVIFASWASDVANQASQGSAELFNQFGQQLIGVQPENGSSATAVITIMAIDTQGYTLPAGTQFLLDNAVGFTSIQSVTIPSGQQSANVTIAAVSSGSDSNGAGSQTGAVLNQQINWVLSVGIVTEASSGTDPETSDAYLNRLANQLQLMAPRPVTAGDFGTFAVNFQPAAGTDQQEVGRATAIDGYDPNALTYGNEREVAVCVTDSSGNALNSDTMTAVRLWLESLREVNFIINVVAPSYSPIYVSCSVVRNTAYSAATVQSNIQSALVTLLSPTNWGLSSSGSLAWVNQPTIYGSVVESTIQQTSGVDHVVTGSLAMGFSPSPGSFVDLALPGPFPLPTTSLGSTVPTSAFTVTN